MNNQQYYLTPSAMRMIDTNDFSEVDELSVLFIRLIQGREMEEYPNPSSADIEALRNWYNQYEASKKIIALVKEGKIFIDFDEEGNLITTNVK
jgi:hypothetical protein